MDLEAGPLTQSNESTFIGISAIDPTTGLPYSINGVPEELARFARDAYLRGEIDVIEFERRLEIAGRAELDAGVAPLDTLPSVGT